MLKTSGRVISYPCLIYFSASVSILHRGTGFKANRSLQRHDTSHRCLGSPTIAQSKPVGQAPRFLIRDRDGKYGQTFKRVTAGRGIEVLRTLYHALQANAICVIFLGSVRRECLDHILVLGESHLYRAIKEYVAFFNQARPHQGIGQNIPERTREGQVEGKGKIMTFPVLNGLHHDYRRAA
jgi:putative transposase